MNFLAHFHLSGDNQHIAMGNYLGDFMRGTPLKSLEPTLQKGVQLHRFIDAFTDAHPLVKETHKFLQPHFSKYAPVVSDVYFDYFLAAHFNDYSTLSLRNYTYHIYGIMAKNRQIMTARASLFYDFVIARDLFFEYGNTWGMGHVFRGLSMRARFVSNLRQGVPILMDHEEQLYQWFKAFYPELQEASARYREENLLNQISK